MEGRVRFTLVKLSSLLFFFQCELIAPSIVKELAKGLDPLKTRETVKLCTNGSRGTSVLAKYFTI